MSKNATMADQEAAEAQKAALGVIEAAEWNGWQRGDVVGVSHAAGTFTITSFRMGDDGRCRWVNCFGGPNGTQEWRSFAPERLQEKPRKRSRRKDISV